MRNVLKPPAWAYGSLSVSSSCGHLYSTPILYQNTKAPILRQIDKAVKTLRLDRSNVASDGMDKGGGMLFPTRTHLPMGLPATPASRPMPHSCTVFADVL